MLLDSMSHRQIDILDTFINAKIDAALKLKHSDKQRFEINHGRRRRKRCNAIPNDPTHIKQSVVPIGFISQPNTYFEVSRFKQLLAIKST